MNYRYYKRVSQSCAQRTSVAQKRGAQTTWHYNRRPDNECDRHYTVRHLHNASLCGWVSNSNRVTIKTRLHLRFSCYLNCNLRGDFAAICLPFCSDILLKLCKVVTLYRLKSEELVLQKTCVEETLVLCPHTYEYFPLIGDPLLLFPFVAFFAVPVFTVSLSNKMASETSSILSVHQGSVSNTPVKIATKSKLNSSKFETLAISRRFYLKIAVRNRRDIAREIAT